MTEKYFGSMVFNDAAMKEYLPPEAYHALLRTMEEGRSLDIELASVIARAMKNWAVAQGATHYTHWFQPLTGVTAEKHDAFLNPVRGGGIVQELSGKSLVRGESDASSFPSGGLRATFEARGYTAWDPTSYAFVKDKTLYIPTAFCSYGGHALDQKTPLLRSMEAVNRQAKRVLKLFGTETRHVNATVGAEQEYFLLDKAMSDRRQDLLFTGRTLFGARPPKGQEMEDHYYGALPPRVQAFMSELDEELWKLGVPVKTEHNEAAPAQHELAPVFSVCNEAADHNQLTMELMKKVAVRHGLTCLLTEKPFAGVNGSGKHVNWSLSTSEGVNLLDPGETPHENAQFLLFLAAVIQAVDNYQELLRACVASAGNDHRLGGNEAPPSVISVFLGDELTEIIHAIMEDRSYAGADPGMMTVGVHVLPKFPRDTTDRNRTSPFAFTGNKFEFRMVGAAASISEPAMVINTIVAQSLKEYADRLEGEADLPHALNDLLRESFNRHARILYNGNNYSEEWEKEAAKRGLSCLRDTVDALPCLLKEENVAVFETQRVLSRTEIASRYEIHLANYSKTVNIEALTAIDMARREILPGCFAYQQKLLRGALDTRALLGEDAPCCQADLAARLNPLLKELDSRVTVLEKAASALPAVSGSYEKACHCRGEILPAMKALRDTIDTLEMLIGREDWPVPTYAELLFSV